MLILAFYGTFFMHFIQKLHDIWDRGGFREREIFLLKTEYRLNFVRV